MRFSPALSADLLPHTCSCRPRIEHASRQCHAVRPNSHRIHISSNVAVSAHRGVQPAHSSSNWVASTGTSVCSPATVRLDSIQFEEQPNNARLTVYEQDGRFSVSGSIDTSLSLDTVWGVITDYERLSEVYSNIQHSRLHHQAGKLCVVQDCKWQFLMFSGTFETSLFMTEERKANRLSFNLAKPSMFMRSFQGRWQLTPASNGGCCVNHNLSVEPSLAPPAFLDGYTEKIFLAQIEGLLADLRQELDRIRTSVS